MAYDLIGGDTPTNWARGTSTLLPHTPTSTSMGRDPRKRLHHLRKIVKRAARGDANASAQMQQVRQRLGQRAAYGDARATRLLQRIAVWYAADRVQYQGTTPAGTMPAAQSFWSSTVQPPGAPPVISPAADVYYPASSFPSTPPGSDEYDDESGRWFNDEEFAAALDGGPCEREAFARMNGSWKHPFKSVGKGLKKAGHGFAKGLKAIPKALAAIPQAIAPPGGSLMGGTVFYPDIRALKRMLRPGQFFSTTDVYPYYPSSIRPHPGKVRRNYMFLRLNPGFGRGSQIRLMPIRHF